jgi:hypothetical protein
MPKYARDHSDDDLKPIWPIRGEEDKPTPKETPEVGTPILVDRNMTQLFDHTHDVHNQDPDRQN